MIKWVKKQTEPIVTFLKGVSNLEEEIHSNKNDNRSMIVFIGWVDTPEYKAFWNLAMKSLDT